MTIRSIEITHHEVALEPPFHPAWDSRLRPVYRIALVTVTTDDGVQGYGSGDAMPGFAGHEELFIGHDPRDLDRHFKIIDNLSFHYGKHWPLDIALWDLAGKIKGEPVWRMLGGAGAPVPAYASLGQRREPEAVAEAARKAVAAGFRAVKLRFYRTDWREDVKAAEAVRAAVGPSIDLMIDCNQAWRMQWDTNPYRTYAEALAVCRAVAPLGIYWIEEPLFRGDYEGLRRLREEAGMRIAGGELTRETHEARHLVETGCYDVIQTDAALAGGISGLAPIARLAARKGIVFTPHTWGSGIMLAANLQLTVGTTDAPYIEYPCDPPEWPVEARDFMLSEPIRPDRDGLLHVGEVPGLGISLDHDRLAATRVG
jgi:L-alanine-DL-glutamate epimerase-like enolase superfamily enzyme